MNNFKSVKNFVDWFNTVKIVAVPKCPKDETQIHLSLSSRQKIHLSVRVSINFPLIATLGYFKHHFLNEVTNSLIL